MLLKTETNKQDFQGLCLFLIRHNNYKNKLDSYYYQILLINILI